eukprot:TRINITY_DN15943_c0_g1_i2.p1 TRINITY_DN15943_c0_g1~~TRINITY_DN15943_c0_g1_i2.p1  ORF type:complete len:391 (+),score=58.03 TRINITY_DN15943_c0_g1_i2:44-1216(+)
MLRYLGLSRMRPSAVLAFIQIISAAHGRDTQAAWVWGGKLYVVRDGRVATMGWEHRTPWDGTLADWGPIMNGSVQTAWVEGKYLYVLKDGQVAKVVWGTNHWDGKVSDWGDLLKEGVQAVFVQNSNFYVIKHGKAATIRWEERHSCNGSFESWGPILQGSVEAAWVADGNLYVVKVFGMEYGWDGSFIDFAPMFHKSERSAATLTTDQPNDSSAATPSNAQPEDSSAAMPGTAQSKDSPVAALKTAQPKDNLAATARTAQQDVKFLGIVGQSTAPPLNASATFATGLRQDPQGRRRESLQEMILMLIGVGVGIAFTAICGMAWWLCCRSRSGGKSYAALENASEGLNEGVVAARPKTAEPIHAFQVDGKKAGRKVAFALPTPTRNQRWQT